MFGRERKGVFVMTEPAHTYDTPAPQYTGPTAVTPVTTRAKMPVGSLILRIVLTLAGAAGLIVGAFLNWIRGTTTAGVDLSAKVYVTTEFAHHSTFYKTAGFAMILAGLVTIVGLAARGGWVTRVAGALGIVGFVLFVIQLYRAPNFSLPSAIGLGAWVCLAGGVVALIGGFFGTRMRAVRTTPAAPPYREVPPPAATTTNP
jgi:hypothetical protein